MQITQKLLKELQNRLKVGNRRGVHLNALPGRSRYKFDLHRLSYINENLPNQFINALLTELPFQFRISWKNNVPGLDSLFEDDQLQLVKITKGLENLIIQTEVIEAEKGINTFGFGFPLLIRRDIEDNKLTVAPILIWSLRIKRTNEFNTWVIARNEEDPIYINEVLINHLQNDVKVEINQIPSEVLDDGLIDTSELVKICADLLESINSITPFNLRERLEQKLNDVIPIPDKKYYEELSLQSDNSFIESGGVFSIFEVQKQSIITDYDHLLSLDEDLTDILDDVPSPFQPISSVETDPSQQSILNSIGSIRNLLVQGPPGTGKSQSLTAILVNALENKKKTVVVCEKRTALEVLDQFLTKLGLDQHCVLINDIVKDRRKVVDAVRDRIENFWSPSVIKNYSKNTLHDTLEKCRRLISSINNKHKKLYENLIGDKNWTDVVGLLLAEQRKCDEYSLKSTCKFEFSNKELNEYLDLVKKGQRLYGEYESYKDLMFLNPRKLIGDNPYVLERRIKNDFQEYEHILKEIKKSEKKYYKEYIRLRKSEFRLQIDKKENLQHKIRQLLSKHFYSDDFLNERKTKSIQYRFLSLFSDKRKKLLSDQLSLKEILGAFEDHINQSKDLPNLQLVDGIEENLEILAKAIEHIQVITPLFDSKIEKQYNDLDLLHFESKEYNSESLDSIKRKADLLSNKIVSDNWVTDSPDLSSYNNLIRFAQGILEKMNAYLSDDADPFTKEYNWYSFYNPLPEEIQLLMKALKSKTDWTKTFLVFYLNELLISYSDSKIPVDDHELKDWLESIKQVSKEQLSFINGRWREIQIAAKKNFDIRNPISVENLYNKRKSHRHKKLTLRQIVNYDIDLFTDFFPIILTTPDVCCSLFHKKTGYFGIVLFDEGSQLKLEDTLPSLLKGKQVIVAGDEHQMPPSNYFSKIFDGTLEDEDEADEEEEIKIDPDNILLSCESLLDFGTELNFEKRYLDFHYRSRHPYLIDFSNHAFYHQRLKPLPSSFDYIPIKYINVNGTYSDHSNDREAETVLSIIEHNIHRMPNGEYPTVGVATFNISQRNLIKSKILERRMFSRFESFNEKIIELEKEGSFFVKNLENIQGDERDVIILSTTYGFNKDGKFHHRFGPINHKKGYKLLNVIITRAKYKIYVCTSVPEKEFLGFEHYLKTEGANNRRGVFFAYLAYAKSVSQENTTDRKAVLEALDKNSKSRSTIGTPAPGILESPFEEEVYRALSEKFNKSKLYPQLQFAGYRIDIVYDPKRDDIPKIAIECDGAKYHSSKEAYLYDYHRQKVLEQHGFVFHRIWSKNWWRNASRETEKLVSFIESVESNTTKQKLTLDNWASAFTDEIELESIVTPQKNLFEQDVEKVEPIEHKPEEVVADIINDTRVVEADSIVRVRYLNTGQILTVDFVKSAKKGLSKSNGVQSINIKSPLADSIMGRSVGETVRVGHLDNYVEILEIKTKDKTL